MEEAEVTGENGDAFVYEVESTQVKGPEDDDWRPADWAKQERDENGHEWSLGVVYALTLGDVVRFAETNTMLLNNASAIRHASAPFCTRCEAPYGAQKPLCPGRVE